MTQRRIRFLLQLAAVLLLAAGFWTFLPFLLQTLGVEGRLFVLVYAIPAALFWGMRGGLLVALLSQAPNYYMSIHLNLELPGGLIGPGFLIVVSALIGRLRDVQVRLRREMDLRQQSDQLNSSRAFRQSALAGLGRTALRTADLQDLLAHAAGMVQRTLEVEFSCVFEKLPDQEALVLRAGAGWPPSEIGRFTIALDGRFPAAFAFNSGRPVLAEDYSAQTRFEIPAILKSAGVKSGMSLPIGDIQSPAGTLSAQSTRPREFTGDDINFLQSVANVLGAAMERHRDKVTIQQINQLMESLLAPAELPDKLGLITDGVVDIFGAQFVRIWMIGEADLCDQGCYHARDESNRHLCGNRERCLHLLASAGNYEHPDGNVHLRAPLGSYRIGAVATGQTPCFLTNRIATDHREHHHRWAREMGLVSFAGYGLRDSSGNPVGVLSLFSRRIISQAEDTLLRSLAEVASQVLIIGTAEQKLQENRMRYRRLVEGLGEEYLIFTMDNYGAIHYISPAVYNMFGVRPEEVVGHKVLDLIDADPQNVALIQRQTRACLAGEEPAPYELTYGHPQGYDKVIEVLIRPLRNNNGLVTEIEGLARDITERKLAEQQIKAALKEKEALLREIHHRVKNSFAVISGLLSLQARRSQDQRVRSVLQDSQNRLATMALIHESLYQQDDLARVDLQTFFRNLAQNTMSLFAGNQARINLEVASGDVPLEVTQAVPCGIIVNELVTNSLKHAFPNGRAGNIAITARALANGDAEITVKDDGVGLPHGQGPDSTDSMGMRLVSLMVKQLRGRYEINGNDGTEVRVWWRQPSEGDGA